MQEERERYAKYSRRSAACDVNVHFMHPEFLRTDKISNNLYYVSDITTIYTYQRDCVFAHAY